MSVYVLHYEDGELCGRLCCKRAAVGAVVPFVHDAHRASQRFLCYPV